MEEQVIQLYNQGKTFDEISELLDIPPYEAALIIRKNNG